METLKELHILNEVSLATGELFYSARRSMILKVTVHVINQEFAKPFSANCSIMVRHKLSLCRTPKYLNVFTFSSRVRAKDGRMKCLSGYEHVRTLILVQFRHRKFSPDQHCN